MPLKASEVEGREWTEFLDWFDEEWKPGQHVSVMAPTGVGKSTFVGGILGLRRYVVVSDPKGGDETIEGFGFRRIPKWPGERAMDKMLEKDEKDGRDSHYIVGPKATRMADWPALRQVTSDLLDGAYDMGGWTLYVDELQIVCDRRMMNLSGKVARWLIAARSGKRSLVTSFQAPSWVPTEALRQPTWVVASHTRDADVVDRTAEVAGRHKAEMRGWMSEIDPWHWLVIPRNPRAPVVVTHPPKI